AGARRRPALARALLPFDQLAEQLDLGNDADFARETEPQRMTRPVRRLAAGREERPSDDAAQEPGARAGRIIDAHILVANDPVQIRNWRAEDHALIGRGRAVPVDIAERRLAVRQWRWMVLELDGEIGLLHEHRICAP